MLAKKLGNGLLVLCGILIAAAAIVPFSNGKLALTAGLAVGALFVGALGLVLRKAASNIG